MAYTHKTLDEQGYKVLSLAFFFKGGLDQSLSIDKEELKASLGMGDLQLNMILVNLSRQGLAHLDLEDKVHITPRGLRTMEAYEDALSKRKVAKRHKHIVINHPALREGLKRSCSAFIGSVASSRRVSTARATHNLDHVPCHAQTA